MIISPGSKVVFIGDSITDCGRSRPVGEGLFNALGNGYVSLIDAVVAASDPEARLRVVNMGSSGNTVRDLAERWQTDVIDLKPDVLSIMIGVNDVWRQFDSPTQTDIHVGLDEYTKTLTSLVEATIPRVRQVILATPFYIEPNRSDAMRHRMDEYGAVVAELASKRGLTLVDTQAAFDRSLAHVHPNALAWDRVHPNLAGSMIIARAFLDALEFRW